MNANIFYPKKESYATMPGFSNLIDSLWRNDYPGLVNKMWEGSTLSPAVNIMEGKENFKIELAAPGLAKEDFKIKVEDAVLSITCEKQEKEEVEKKELKEYNYTQKEFSYRSFSRSFTLPETVNTEKIGAEYKDGILMLNLPKKEEAKVPPVKEIQVW